MKGIGDKLLGSASRFSFEQRIFNFAMLIGVALTLFGTVMDLYYGSAVLFDMAFLACWMVTYYISRSGRGYHKVSVIAIAVFVFAFIPYEWINSGGIKSAIPYYTILFIAMVAIILRKPMRVVMVISMMAVELLLIALELYDGHLPWGNFFGTAIHLIAALAATALLVIVYSKTYMAEKQRGEAYAKAIEASARQQQYYVENLEHLIGSLKSERHDFNNHLSVINGLLESGETDKAKSYAAQLVKDAAEYQNIVNVPYPAVRALLNHKLSAARDSGIELRLDVGLPEGLKLNEFDLTAILGNLLDNAAEACAGLTKTSPYINFTLKFQPDYLVVRIANPFIPPPEGKRGTTKTNPENHGFGLKNVEYLVDRHNGLMEIKKEDGIFEVDIALLVE